MVDAIRAEGCCECPEGRDRSLSCEARQDSACTRSVLHQK